MLILLLLGVGRAFLVPEDFSTAALPYGPVVSHGSASDGNVGLICGGSDESGALDQMAWYEGGTWTVATMAGERGHCAAIAANGLFFVGGGTSPIEIFSATTKALIGTTVFPNPDLQNGACLSTDGQRIYVTHCTLGPTLAVHVFDTVGGGWTELSHPDPPRYRAAQVFHKGKLYLAGGEDDRCKSTFGLDVCARKNLQAYDPAKGLWAVLAPLPYQVARMYIAGVGDKLIIAGGYVDFLVATIDMIVYDITTNVHLTKEMPAVVNTHPYGFGQVGNLLLFYENPGILADSNKVVAYDVEADVFDSGPFLSVSRFGIGIITVGSEVLFVGGAQYDGGYDYSVGTVDIYSNGCGDPGEAPLFGTRTGSSFREGDAVTFECNDGYTLTSNGDLLCTASGWNKPVPSCEGVICPPLTIAGGSAGTCDGSQVTGESCSITCDDGYAHFGAPSQECTPTGPSSAAYANTQGCDAAICAEIAAPANGTIGTCTAQPTGSSCSITCEPGFVITGGDVQICEGTGPAVAAYPSSQACASSACTNPSGYERSLFSCGGSLSADGAVCAMQCKPGFVGAPTAYTCVLTAWDSTEVEPTCAVAADATSSLACGSMWDVEGTTTECVLTCRREGTPVYCDSSQISGTGVTGGDVVEGSAVWSVLFGPPGLQAVIALTVDALEVANVTLRSSTVDATSVMYCDVPVVFGQSTLCNIQCQRLGRAVSACDLAEFVVSTTTTGASVTDLSLTDTPGSLAFSVQLPAVRGGETIVTASLADGRSLNTLVITGASNLCDGALAGEDPGNYCPDQLCRLEKCGDTGACGLETPGQQGYGCNASCYACDGSGECSLAGVGTNPGLRCPDSVCTLDTCASGACAFVPAGDKGHLCDGEGESCDGSGSCGTAAPLVVDEAAESKGSGGAIIGAVVGGSVLCCCIVIIAIVVAVSTRSKSKFKPTYGDDDNDTVKMDVGGGTSLGTKARATLEAKGTVEIGRGGAAIIYKAKWDGELVAMKVLKETSITDATEFNNEILIMTKLATSPHPSVIDLRLIAKDQQISCIVMELADLGSLKALCTENDRPFSERLDWSHRIAEGMQHLHALSVAHCDMKPGNCLLTKEGLVKICDFGCAAVVDGPVVVTQFAGTVTFAPPERLQAKAIDLLVCDVYSFALTVFNLLTGTEPYSEIPNGDVLDMKKNASPEPVSVSSLLPGEAGGAVAALYSRSISHDPFERPTLAEWVVSLHSGDDTVVMTLGKNNSERFSSTTSMMMMSQ